MSDNVIDRKFRVYVIAHIVGNLNYVPRAAITVLVSNAKNMAWTCPR